MPREPRPSRVAAATAPGEFLLDRSDGDLSACTLIGAEGLTIPVGGVSGTAPLAILSAPGVEGSVRTVAGATYAARRTFGKLGGATVAARQIGGLPPAARKYFGLCLLSSLSLAIGLTIQIRDAFPEVAQTVTGIVLAAVILFEIAGPLRCRFALMRAGEAQARLG